MIARFTAWMTALIAIAAVMTTTAAVPATITTGSTPVAPARSLHERLPLLFEPRNAGGESPAHFVAHGANYRIAVSAQGAQVAIPVSGSKVSSIPEHESVTSLRFTGANPQAIVRGIDPQVTRFHHFRTKDDALDLVDNPAYARVGVADIYPGIDLVFYGNAREVEYDLVVAPGADPAAIRFGFDGVAHLALDANGDLRIATGAGAMMLQRPLAYQERAGRRENVDSAFVLDSGHDVRIRVGDYDHARALVIDPVLSYATYLGGKFTEQGTAIAIDANGSVYVTGYTSSSDFPILSSYDRSLGKNDYDVFVTKLKPDGTGIVYSTFLGGANGQDRAIGIALDASGNAYVTGRTSASDFPVTANAYQKGATGGGSFVAKLGPAGDTLLYSTYLVGATSNAIAVDATGSAYVTGAAAASFSTTAGAFQRTSKNPSGTTGFVLKLNPAGSAPIWATFLGGAAGESGSSIAVDARGDAYVGGWTASRDFPVAGGLQITGAGQKDAFISRLDAGGGQLVYSTYLGGTLDDTINAIAIDSAGSAYVAGETYSENFPSIGGFQPRKSGYRLVNSSLGNAFVSKLAPSGASLEYSSFLGGEICTGYCQTLGAVPQYPGDAAYGIAVDAAGHAFVTGLARTYTFPLVDSSSTAKQDELDESGFVAKIAVSGGALLYSTFIRSGFRELDNQLTRFPLGSATGVAVDADGTAYVTGDADLNSDFQPTAGAFQIVNGGGQGAIVVKLGAAPATLSLTTSSPTTDTLTPITLTATASGAPLSGYVSFMIGASTIAGTALAGNSATVSLKLPAGIHSVNAILRAAGATIDSPAVRQIVDNPLACN